MALRFAGELQSRGEQPTLPLGIEVKVVPLVQLGFRGEGLGLEDFRLQADQHRGGKEGFAGFGEVLLVAAAASLVEGRHELGHFNALPQLIEEAVDDSDDIDVPGVEITPLGGVLQQPDRKPGATFGNGFLRTGLKVPV